MNIPGTLQQGDSATWGDDPFTDVNGKSYTAPAYALAYVLAGPSTPITLTAVADGSGWKTSITTTQSAGMTPGTWWWQAALTATGERVTIGAGELIITANLATLSAVYDGRSLAEKSLADAEAALANLTGSGVRVKEYTIGSRSAKYYTAAELLEAISYWKARVLAEQGAKAVAQGLGNPRKLHVRFR
jgi:hypothetical protein